MRGSGISQHPGAEVRENLSFVKHVFVHRPEASLALDKELRTAAPKLSSRLLGLHSQTDPCASLAELPQLRTQVLSLPVYLAHGVNSAPPQPCSGSARQKLGEEQLPLKWPRGVGYPFQVWQRLRFGIALCPTLP